MEQDYAKATYELIVGGADIDATLTDLKKTLENKGHAKRYPAILRELHNLAERQERGGTTVIVARESDLSKYKSTIEALIKKNGLDLDHQVVIDKTIIGGHIIENEDLRIDHSYKRKLLDVYESSTN